MTHTTPKRHHVRDAIARNLKAVPNDILVGIATIVACAAIIVFGGWMLFAQSTTEYTSTPATTHGYSQLMVGTDRSGSSVACFKGDLFCPEDAVPYEEYFANLKQDLPLDIGELSNNHVG